MIKNSTLSDDIYDKVFFNGRGRSNSPSSNNVALTHIYYTESDQILFVHDGIFDTILELSQGKNMLMGVRKEKESSSDPSQYSDNLYSSRGICGLNAPSQLFLIKKRAVRSYGVAELSHVDVLSSANYVIEKYNTEPFEFRPNSKVENKIKSRHRKSDHRFVDNDTYRIEYLLSDLYLYK
jgi:hypothetical protein